MFKKNTTDINDQPTPTPHPCGKWSKVDCNLLAHGYNTPFFSDPHEEDVHSNSTLPCSPDDCNDAGIDDNSSSTDYYFIIGFGALFVVATLVVLYKKLGSRLQNEYQRLSDDGPLLTKDKLIEHDKLQGEKQHLTITPQFGYSHSSNFITYDDPREAQHTNAAVPQKTEHVIQPLLRLSEGMGSDTSDNDSSSDKSSPGSVIHTSLWFSQGHGSDISDDSSSDKSSPGPVIYTSLRFSQGHGSDISDDSSSDKSSPGPVIHTSLRFSQGHGSDISDDPSSDNGSPERRLDI